MAEVYQGFRSAGGTHPSSPVVDKVVRIQTHIHPISGERFVIWSDIAHCFPGVTRIQNGDIFVSLLRNERLYRVRPHGIKYHPDVVLDVIYDQRRHIPTSKRLINGTSSSIGPSIAISDRPSAITNGGSPPPSSSSSSPLSSFSSSPVGSTTAPTSFSSLDPPHSTSSSSKDNTSPAIVQISAEQKNLSRKSTEQTDHSHESTGQTNSLDESPPSLVHQLEKAFGPLFESLTSSSSELQSIIQRMDESVLEAKQANVVTGNNDFNGITSVQKQPVLADSQQTGATAPWMDNVHVQAALRLVMDRSRAILNTLDKTRELEANWPALHPHFLTEIGNIQQQLVVASTEIPSAVIEEVNHSTEDHQELQHQSVDEELPSESQEELSTEPPIEESGSVNPAKDSVTPATMTMGELRKLKETFKKASSQEIIRMMESNQSESSRQKSSSLDERIDESADESLDAVHQHPASGGNSTVADSSTGIDKNISALRLNRAIVKMEQLTAVAGAAASLKPTSGDSLRVASNGAKSPFSSLDIVNHRVREILAHRYAWIESPCPKLFVILPTDPDSFPHQNWSDFELHFLCDCGDIPIQGEGFVKKCNPNSDDKDCHCMPHLLPGFKGVAQQKDLLKFGNYMMAILEMLEYGSRVDGTGIVPLLKDPMDRKRVMYSMVFLMKQGIESSHQLLAKGYASLDDIKPAAPLTEAELMDMYRTRINERRPYRLINVFQTLAGDVRWMCKEHCAKHTPSVSLDSTLLFRQFSFERGLGTLVATIKSAEKAQALYEMIIGRPTIPAISMFLDWELSEKDEDDLQNVVDKMWASCARICVRDRPDNKNPMVPGFGHGFYNVIQSALENEKIQAFTVERHVSDEISNEGIDELFACKGAVYMDPVIARFTREPKSNKVQLGLLVTDLDQATHELRVALRGFSILSKLTLEASYWDHIDIDFSDIQGNVEDIAGARIVDISEDDDDEGDEDLKEEESLVEFFNRRNRDSVSVRTYLSADTVFLKTHILKDINIRIIFPEDGPRIRELIKNNTRLTKIELSIDCKDDPCQVFEYFKAIMNNHPSLESFHLRKDWGKSSKSTFVWHGVSDRSKMSLSIMSYAEDKIGTLLQKFGACLLQIFLQSINIQDSVILEKVTRSRKNQLKLSALSLLDVFQISLTALDELAKVVLRVPLQRFQVTGTVNPRTASRVGEFMNTVASKITDIHFYGEHTKSILSELAKRMPESSNMEQLKELKLSGPFDAATKDLTWIRSVLDKPIPLVTIELHKVNLSHQGWMTLAQEIDFKRMEYFRVGPDVPLKIEAVKAFVEAVPSGSELENFHLDSAGLNERHCGVYKATVLGQLRKKTALVSIGRYF